MQITGIILAAGKGTRMNSSLPKVLHPVAGRSMLAHVHAALRDIPLAAYCLVLNEQLEPFAPFIGEHPDLNICVQHTLNGTGSAVAACAPLFSNTSPLAFAPSTLHRGRPHAPSHVLICAGDCPAIEASTLRTFIDQCSQRQSKLALLVMELDHPTGYGRVVVDAQGRLRKIVEEKDATAAEKQLRLCNSGILFAETALLFDLLGHLRPHNAQQEYYLTDCVAAAQQRGAAVHAFRCPDYRSCLGVNTSEQLATIEAFMFQRRSAAASSHL